MILIFVYLNFGCSKFTFGVLDVGLDVWDIVDGVKALTNGNPKAKLFREAGEKLQNTKNNVTEEFDSIKGRCDGSSKQVKFKLEQDEVF